MKTILKKVFQASMAILSIMWLILGIIRIFGSGSAFMGILMLINGAAFALFAFVYISRAWIRKWGLGWIVLNLILTVIDQMRFFDYIVLIIGIVALVSGLMLIKDTSDKSEV